MKQQENELHEKLTPETISRKKGGPSELAQTAIKNYKKTATC